MNAESLLHERGRVAVVAHKDQFTREEKDALRGAQDLVQMGNYYALLIAEEPDEFDPEDDDQRSEQPVKTLERGDRYLGGEPTMADLRALKVAELQALADKEEVDLTGLKLKDDILGRLAAHFGLDPAS